MRFDVDHGAGRRARGERRQPERGGYGEDRGSAREIVCSKQHRGGENGSGSTHMIGGRGFEVSENISQAQGWRDACTADDYGFQSNGRQMQGVRSAAGAKMRLAALRVEAPVRSYSGGLWGTSEVLLYLRTARTNARSLHRSLSGPGAAKTSFISRALHN